MQDDANLLAFVSNLRQGTPKVAKVGGSTSRVMTCPMVSRTASISVSLKLGAREEPIMLSLLRPRSISTSTKKASNSKHEFSGFKTRNNKIGHTVDDIFNVYSIYDYHMHIYSNDI